MSTKLRLLESLNEVYRYELIGYACSNLTREELIDLTLMHGLKGLEDMYNSHIKEVVNTDDRDETTLRAEYEESGRYDDLTTTD